MFHTAGNNGEGVRSDCQVSLTPDSGHGISLHLNSKVKSMYGGSIEMLCRDMFRYYGIDNATMNIDDSGALPFTLAARIEAVIRKHLDTTLEYLMPVLPGNDYRTSRDTERISRLYLPGNNPKLMINAGIYGCHGIILDLEDSVHPGKKYEARFLVRNALRSVNFYGAERMVRINQLPEGLKDLDFVIPHQVNLILIPKCESPEQVALVDRKISEIMGERNTSVWLMPIIENAAGVLKAYEIARASENVVAMAIGLEDYTADLGVQRTIEGKESFFARSMVVNAARAAGIQPIDSVFSDIDDMETLAERVRESKSLGFAGMGCIHPRQISVINENFLPDEHEIDRARKITLAYEKAEKEGLGVVAADSKMIDMPVVNRALKTIEKAVKSGRLNSNWRETNGR